MERAEPKVLIDDHDQNGQHVRFYATAGIQPPARKCTPGSVK
ncbi:hypothetical protein AAFN47_21020 [Hoeflea sp. CAU 1731]